MSQRRAKFITGSNTWEVKIYDIAKGADSSMYFEGKIEVDVLYAIINFLTNDLKSADKEIRKMSAKLYKIHRLSE